MTYKQIEMKSNLFKKSWNWRGNKKLPIQYVLFFVLIFFLFGEQFIALPLYIFGPGVQEEKGPDKLHILDLAPSDALHRPLFYFLFGFLSLGLFRLLSWPIVWVSAYVIWAFLQFFTSNPGVSLLEFIGVGFFVLVPYFIYQNIDRKWGVKGRQNAILILIVINILVFCFFAFQIYGLNNSYRGYRFF